MIDVQHKRCIFDGCNKQPNFNLPTETNGIYCFDHKKENMIDIKSKRCIFDGCNKRPYFNLPTETKGIYCYDHKKENMIDVQHKRCIFEGCNKQPNFNLPTETKGIYCYDHKKDNMIDVKNKRCIFDGCNKIPVFNLPTETKGIYCFEHKKENMIDAKNKHCIFYGCNKQPAFNLPTETKGIYCFDHKKENMISINKKKCQFIKCKELAIYGFVGKRKQYCNKHKQKNMINLNIEYKCSKCDSEYDFIIDNIKYCLKHCPNKKYEIKIKKKCKICDIEAESNYICKDCKQISTKKEYAIVRYIKKKIDTPFKHNTNEPVNECSNRRPDIIFELNKHVVIVEIDENQHKSYQESCECARMNEIINSIGGKSVIFIRYNPDNTYNKGNKQNIKLQNKLHMLIKTIKKELINEYDKFTIKLIQLYYDDNYDVYKPKKKENITNKLAI